MQHPSVQTGLQLPPAVKEVQQTRLLLRSDQLASSHVQVDWQRAWDAIADWTSTLQCSALGSCADFTAIVYEALPVDGLAVSGEWA